MAEVTRGNLDAPDEVLEFPKITASLVDLGDLTVGLMVSQPGWRWSEHNRPKVGGEWCQARHVGVVLAGRVGIEFSDGTTAEFGPHDVFDIPPGHDGFTVGDEPCVQIEWAGLRAWAGFPTGIHSRVLRTLLFTDLVESTEMAGRLGDARWRELLSGHFEAVRDELERFRGREVTTTGDGVLATFDGPALALRCAAAIRTRANNDASPPSRGCPRRRGRARGGRRPWRRRARGGAHHGRREHGRDPRLRPHAGACELDRPAVRGPRHARAQGPRRRVEARRLRHLALSSPVE